MPQKEVHGRVFDRVARLLPKKTRTVQEQESIDAARMALDAAKASLSWQLPRSLLELDWSKAESPVELFPGVHLGILARISNLVTAQGGTSSRRNGGLLGFARVLEVHGAKLDLHTGPNGTYLRTYGILPPSVSRSAARNQAVLRELIRDLQKQACESSAPAEDQEA